MHRSSAPVESRTGLVTPHVQANAARRREALSLVASENVMSPAALHACGSDLNHRYTIPPADARPPEIWEYPRQESQRAIERVTRELAEQLFGAEYADVRPLSGNNAVFAVMQAAARPGDIVLRVPARCGGHFATDPIAETLGVELRDIPFDEEAGVVDVEALVERVQTLEPALVLFDASMVLFMPPIRALRQAVGPDVLISYDGSHTLGMIAGGEFGDPLSDGADLLHGSTHKSLFGPQKGLILCRRRGGIADRLAGSVVPLFASNIHTHHVAGLGVALEELVLYGRSYAQSVLANARTLARTLEDQGFVLSGAARNYTDCHQLWLQLGSREEALEGFRALESLGILANPIKIPFSRAYGLRLGLSELTRLGMRETSIRQLGLLMGAVLRREGESAHHRDAVCELARAHRRVHFALPSIES